MSSFDSHYREGKTTSMEKTNKNNSETKEPVDLLEKAAEAWVRLCLFHIQHKKQLANQHKNKKYEQQTT